jgi:hypothetical protein
MSDDIGQSVRDRLAATPQVTKLTGQNIYADVLEAGPVSPAVVVVVSASQAHEDLNTSNRVFQTTLDVFAYGRTRREANELGAAIRSYALAADLRGSVHGMEWREVSLVAGPAEVVDAPREGSDQWRRITHQTFVIWNSPT